MDSEEDSLIKYDDPIEVIITSEEEAAKEAAPEENILEIALSESPTGDPVERMEKILHQILPPREWSEGGQFWMRRVSSFPGSQQDVVNLQKQLFLKLEQRQARAKGVCPIRRELFRQCFDELIRQETINCPERGILLLHVREELCTTVTALKTQYEKCRAHETRKALEKQQNVNDFEKEFEDQRTENEDLKRQLNEQRDRFDDMEMCVTERRKELVKTRTEEIQSLRRIVQHLKAELQLALVSDN